RRWPPPRVRCWAASRATSWDRLDHSFACMKQFGPQCAPSSRQFRHHETATQEGRNMRALLTSSGIRNRSIHDALVDLLGKPIAESNALFIPTAIYPFPGGPGMAWRAICGKAPSPLCELGWKSLGVLELTALPSIEEATWVPVVRDADALLVGGGDPLFLAS